MVTKLREDSLETRCKELLSFLQALRAEITNGEMVLVEEQVSSEANENVLPVESGGSSQEQVEEK